MFHYIDKGSWCFFSARCPGSIVEQLEELGRNIVHVPEGPDSPFESIVMQLEDPTITATELKLMASAIGCQTPCQYMKPGEDYDQGAFVRQIKRMVTCPAPNRIFLYQFLAMVHDVVNRKIVIIRSREEPIILNDDDEPISEQDIVIVECTPITMYHGTTVARGMYSATIALL